MSLTEVQSMVCFLIGAGSVTAVWGFVTFVNWKDRKRS